MLKKPALFVLLVTAVSFCGRGFAADPVAAAHPQRAPGEKSLTLQDCFELAKNQNEKLKSQREAIEQYRLRRRDAVGSILPDVHWKQSTTWQDTTGVSVSTSSNFDNTSFQRSRNESRFTFSQPIFSGFKEFAAMSGYAAATRAETYNLARATVLLYRDVAAAFLNAVSLETDLANVRTAIKADEDRLKELRERIRVGRSRESELASAESQLANLKSQEARTLGDLAVARENLSFLIGQDASNTPLVDNLGTPSLSSEEQAIQTAENRSDLLALHETVEGKRYAIKVARSDFWPDVGVTGNYYTRRLGFFKNIDWDVALNIDVPIFQGGQTKALSDIAVSEWKQAKFEYDLARRQAISEIKRARASLQASLQTADLLEDAYRKAKRSYELQAKEYRYGLVSNLEVLQALSTLLDVKKGWDHALVQSKFDAIDFMAATEKDINP